MSEEKKVFAFDKLKVRQQRFILEYLKDLNGTQAAIRVGYSKKSARQIATENLSKPSIKAVLDEKINEILNDKKELILRMRKEYECLAFSNIKDYIDFDDKMRFKITNESDTRPIESVQVDKALKGNKKNEYEVESIKFKMHSKLKALDGLKDLLGIAAKLQLVDSEGNDLFKAFMKNLGEE